MTGLAVYDGKQWNSRTFKRSEGSLAVRVVDGLFQLKDCGPYTIAEGPPGTIWFGGDFGVWRFRDGRYEEITSNAFDHLFGMAVDHQEALWVVTTYNVQRFDGKTWKTMLCPYLDNSIHPELTALRGIAIGTNGNIWIGATLFNQPQGPWSHEGPVWVVDQAQKTRSDGPPMAPLFEFDGKRWRAFGPQHGLAVKSNGGAYPALDELGRIQVRTSEGRYLLEGETWKPITKPEVKQWILRERKNGFFRSGAELLYQDGENLVEVLATNQQTGKLMDLRSEQKVTLCLVEDRKRNCVWLGTSHGLYRIWRK
jgi:ligand-binding sensor domain-containing protein